MYIAFLRHGQANPVQTSDVARTLTESGQSDIESLGRVLASFNCKFNVCLYSPLVRTQQTAHIIAKHILFDAGVIQDDRLRSGSSFEDYADIIKDFKHFESILLVGHMPEIGSVPTDLLNTSIPLSLSPGSFLSLSTPFFQPGGSSLQMYLPIEYVRNFPLSNT